MLTDAQLLERKDGLGGSDSGAILGLNPYRTPLDVYLEKRGESAPLDLSDNQAVHFGNVLEDVVAEEYVRRTGNKVRRVNQMLRHPDHSFMTAYLDRKITGDRKVLECKTAGQYASKQWGPSGTDQVPEWYLAQVTHYMIVTGYHCADLATLIGGQDFRIYSFTLDDELAGIIVRAEEEFWQLVQDGIAPAPVNTNDLETLYAIDNGESLLADDETIATILRLKTLRDQIKVLKGEDAKLAFDIKKAMNDCSVLLGDDGAPLVTWKKSKDSKRLNGDLLKIGHPDIYERYLKTQAGSRRFLLK